MLDKIFKIIGLLGITLLICSVVVICKELFTTMDIVRILICCLSGFVGILLVATGLLGE